MSRTNEERTDCWERHTRAAIGVSGGLFMVGIAIVQKDLTAGVVGYGFAAVALVEAERDGALKTLALIFATFFILYMIANSLFSIPGEFDLWMGLPPLLAPLAAHWGGKSVRRRKSAR